MTREPYRTAGAARTGKTSPALVVGIILGMIVLAGGVMWALLKFAGPAAQPAATQPSEAGPTAVVLDPPAIEASALDLLVLYKDKQAEAKGKYDGKVVDVTGAVFEEGTDLAGERAINLEGGRQAKFAGVRCVFPAANYFQLAEIEKGQTVTIRGRCQGRVSDVVLRDCAVLKSQK